MTDVFRQTGRLGFQARLGRLYGCCNQAARSTSGAAVTAKSLRFPSSRCWPPLRLAGTHLRYSRRTGAIRLSRVECNHSAAGVHSPAPPGAFQSVLVLTRLDARFPRVAFPLLETETMHHFGIHAMLRWLLPKVFASASDRSAFRQDGPCLEAISLRFLIHPACEGVSVVTLPSHETGLVDGAGDRSD